MSTSFTDLLTGMIIAEDGTLAVTVTEDWMQGRATYGGLTTAIAYHAVIQQYPDLPPLRSVQVGFIGPAGGEIKITPSLLRQGKSVSFIGTDIDGEKGLATRCIFAFGAPRESKFDERHVPFPDLPIPEDTPAMFPPDYPRPQFTAHFETRTKPESRPCSSSGDIEHFYWIRHNDRKADDLTGLIALADMPPPAIMPKFDTLAPISSINWTFNLLTDMPQTEEGWWLLRSSVEQAQHGYSSQDMTIWNRQGQPIMAARQSVALFL